MSPTTDWTVDKVRSSFIEYFQKKEHTYVPSSPTIPHEDPTLLFTNAGMNQFKPLFLGQADPNTELGKLKRAVNSQTCIRAGGKHNDLDDVGKDSYHHTFFEMLGTWSFGDYFKEEAIAWAFDILTTVYGLDPARMYVTYFQGDDRFNLKTDLEAKEIWKKYLPESKIIPGNMKDNFWEMGETGPCGACSEIHYDRIGGRDAAHLVNKDDPTVLEIWNLVFIEFERQGPTTFVVLPNKHVDTGMGLERLSSILINKMSNYDIDIFQNLFADIHKACPSALPYANKYGPEDPDFVDTAYRVVADHIRTLTFAISDGCQPSNEGRGYVLRRVLRRAVRYGKEKLNAPDLFFHNLVDSVVRLMGHHFTNLKQGAEDVKDTLKYEEIQFGKTLLNGQREFAKRAGQLKKGDVLDGKFIFLLRDTFGFPYDLTERMAEERGLLMDKVGYEGAYQVAIQLSKDAHAEEKKKMKSGATLELDGAAVKNLNDRHIAVTDDTPKYEVSEENTFTNAKVASIFDGTGFVDSVEEGKVAGIVFDRTSFYAEAGGQIFDLGFVSSPSGRFSVEDVQSFGGYVLHSGTVRSGRIAVGDAVELHVDFERRQPVMVNHTSTHMVNLALRKVAGQGLDQKGSLVLPERFRFDFSHKKGLSKEEIHQVDNYMAEIIKQDLEVYTKDVALSAAYEINGVRAMFGEAYPDPVRVVCMGVPVETLLADPKNSKWVDYSVEFCGGTHISRSSHTKLFYIVEERALAAGVRRLTAVTGNEARKATENADDLEREVEQLSRIPLAKIGPLLTKVQEQINKPDTLLPLYRKKVIQEKLDELNKKYMTVYREQLKSQSNSNAGIVDEIISVLEQQQSQFVVKVFDPISEKVFAQSTQKIKGDIATRVGKMTVPAAVLVILPNTNGKQVAVIARVTAPLQSQIKASEWCSKVATVLGGKGGGKDDQAQGSGVDCSKTSEAYDAGVEFAKSKL